MPALRVRTYGDHMSRESKRRRYEEFARMQAQLSSKASNAEDVHPWQLVTGTHGDCARLGRRRFASNCALKHASQRQP